MFSQSYVFLIFILSGFLIGIIFDFFRILRKTFKTNDFFTILEDICFWITSSIIIVYSILKFNQGEIRAYIFIGIILGFLLYLITFSKPFIIISVKTNKLLLFIINMLIIKPIIFIYSTIILKIIKLLYKFYKKILVLLKKCVLFKKKKKDFV